MQRSLRMLLSLGIPSMEFWGLHPELTPRPAPTGEEWVGSLAGKGQPVPGTSPRAGAGRGPAVPICHGLWCKPLDARAGTGAARPAGEGTAITLVGAAPAVP